MSQEIKKISHKDVFSHGYVHSCCGGHVPLAIATTKYEDLEGMINSANLSLTCSMKDSIRALCRRKETEDAQLEDRFNHLRHAILDYNACYDYCLQVIYFAFEFCGNELPSEENEFDKVLRDCVYQIPNEKTKPSKFYKNLEQASISESYAKQLKERLDEFISKRTELAKWANAIKHRGGIVINGLGYNRTDIGLGAKFSYIRHPDGTIDLKFYQDKIIPLKRYIEPIVLDLSDTICKLIQQNNIICEFAEWLFTFVGFSKIPTQKLNLFDDIRPFHFENQ